MDVRHDDTERQIRQLLDAMFRMYDEGEAAGYITEVDDEYADPVAREHIDTAAERLFRKIKPLAELAVDDDLVFKYEPDQVYETGDQNTVRSLPYTLMDRHNNIATLDNTRKDIRDAYKILRRRGYKPLQIQQAVNQWSDYLNMHKDAEPDHDKVPIMQDLVTRLPVFRDKLNALVKQLQDDPEMISDIRSKNIVNGIRYKYG
jgi:hypothetical protein